MTKAQAASPTQPSQTPAQPPLQSLPELCLQALRRHAKTDAINHKRGGEWVHIAAEEFALRVRATALGLAQELGIGKGDRVALLSENRSEWSLVDLAILSLGAINVPIYTTQAPEQVRYILENSGARVVFVSSSKVYRHARSGIAEAKNIERIVFFDAGEIEASHATTMLAALEEKGRELDRLNPHAWQKFVEAIDADDLATIIYTSGTTGEPKGVMLSHRNFVSNVLAISNTLPISSSDVSLSVLPLSHIFERTVFYVFCRNGVSVYYAASFDQVGELLREVKPTIMTAVPRLFEKVYHRIMKQGTATTGLKRKIFFQALENGQRYAELKNNGQTIPLSLRAQHTIGDRLVFSKWREGVGGRLRYFVSGGAPLSPALSYAFLAADIPILQGYGMTETCIVSANRPESNKVGTVGLPFPGVEVKLAADGEILVRGENIMRGYYGQPEETRKVFTEDGWFMTGDVGRLDASGRLSITDRKKELFKLSNGKYVAPQLVESLIKQSALVNQVVVLGTGRKQPVALIVPEWEALKSAMVEAKATIPPTRAEWSTNAAAVKLVQREIARLTSTLADYERVRKIALLPEELTIDGGELTPTLKVKRRVIDEKFADVIGELYSETSGSD